MNDRQRMLRIKAALEQLYYKGVELYSGRTDEKRNVLREAFFNDVNRALISLHEERVISGHECELQPRQIHLQFKVGPEFGCMSLLLPYDLRS